MTVEEHTPDQLISYAQNGEDIVLWRALGHIDAGNYIDVGAAHPVDDSVTKVFYDHGWSGINVEPLPQLARTLREERPRDLIAECGVGESADQVTFYGVPDTGLSSLSKSAAHAAGNRGFEVTKLQVQVRPLNEIVAERFSPGDDLHFLKVDVEGAEESALLGFDLDRWRPWVVVVEAIAPNSTESTRDTYEYILTAAGYEPLLFDGLNVFYVSPDHPELTEKLSYPANPIDPFIRNNELMAREAHSEHHAALRWQGAWAGAQVKLADVQRALVEQERVTQKAEESARKGQQRAQQFSQSPWWKLTAPARIAAHKVKGRRPKAEAASAKRAQTSISPAGTARPAEVAEALRLRLLTITAEIGYVNPPDIALLELLKQLTDSLDSAESVNPLLWLSYIAFVSEFPTDDDMFELRTRFDLDQSAAVVSWLSLRGSKVPATWATTAPMRLIREPFIDVTETARYDLHTGIQRVVRETIPRWAASHDLVLAALDDGAPVWRPITDAQADRVLRWGEVSTSAVADEVPSEILVPWDTTVLLPELAEGQRRTSGLSALSKWSNSDFSCIFYDMIPFSMSEAHVDGMHGAFAQFVTTVRTADRISTISDSVAQDLRGFLVSVKNQGLEPPHVSSHLLPVQATTVEESVVEANRGALLAVPGIPLVLSVSSIEPRKNHLTILTAAEKLWREGHSFQLLFVAGSGWKRKRFDAQLSAAQNQGRPVRVISQASEDMLWAAYRLARFTVFISLTEGFGLPASESIAVGTPVVLSNFGSMKEIGDGGGAEFVDPRDLDDVTDAMRRLLVDDARLAELTREAINRKVTTWDDYAASTWNWLVHGEGRN